MVREGGKLKGAEAVVDKDLCTALLAERVGAKRMVIVTDVKGIKDGYKTDDEKLIRYINADDLRGRLQNGEFPAGSMAPKVHSVLEFIDATGGTAAIGALNDLTAVVHGKAGTQIHPNKWSKH